MGYRENDFQSWPLKMVKKQEEYYEGKNIEMEDKSKWIWADLSIFKLITQPQGAFLSFFMMS